MKTNCPTLLIIINPLSTASACYQIIVSNKFGLLLSSQIFKFCTVKNWFIIVISIPSWDPNVSGISNIRHPLILFNVPKFVYKIMLGFPTRLIVCYETKIIAIPKMSWWKINTSPIIQWINNIRNSHNKIIELIIINFIIVNTHHVVIYINTNTIEKSISETNFFGFQRSFGHLFLLLSNLSIGRNGFTVKEARWRLMLR